MHSLRRTLRLRALGPALVIFGVTGVLVGAHVISYQKISPYDEGVHYDYLVKMQQGDMVREGDLLGQIAMREIACRGIDYEGIVLPRCDQQLPFDPGQFPNLGYNSADIHSPAYYFVTAWLAKALVVLSPLDSTFIAARLVGILWLGLGLLMAWAICRELGLRTMPTAIVLLLVTTNTWVLHASSTVNNDATALLAGGSVVLATLRWERGATPLWLVAAAAFVAPFLKVTNAFAAILCGLYLLLNQGARRKEEGIPSGGLAVRRTVLTLVGVSLLAVTSWVVVHAALASPVTSPLESESRASGFDLNLAVPQFLALVTPLSGSIPTDALGGLAFGAVANLVGLLIVAACFAPLLSGSFRGREDAVAGAGALSMLLSGPLFFLANYVLFGIEFGVQPRYGLSLVPALAAALAGALRWRWAVSAVGVFAVVVAVVTFGALVST